MCMGTIVAKPILQLEQVQHYNPIFNHLEDHYLVQCVNDLVQTHCTPFKN